MNTSNLLDFIKKYFYALGSCLYLFTVGIFSPRNRYFLTVICKRFGWRSKVPHLLPRVELSSICPQRQSIIIHEPMPKSGNVSAIELVAITELVQKAQPKKIFEIGTLDGRTTLNLAANTTGEAQVLTLDLPKDQSVATKLSVSQGDKEFINKSFDQMRFEGTEYEQRITRLFGDSATFDYTPYEGQIDFVFVDGAHSYDYVLSDSAVAMKLLKNGKGVIVWHDYGGWDSVTQALNELYQKGGVFADMKHIADTSLVVLQIS